MRAAILGAGSLGTVLGASIAHNGGQVTLIDANKEHIDAMKKNGASIDGHLDLKNVPVQAITPDEMDGIYDLVIVLLKQTANRKALTHLTNYLNDDSIVLTLQNGLPEEHVAEIIGAERTLTGAVTWAGLWTGPGKSRLVTDMSTFYVEVGTLDGKPSAKLDKAGEFIKIGCGVRYCPDLADIRWTKLVVNATMSGMSAAIGDTMGAVVRDDRAALCAAHTGNEVVRVMKAKGVKIAPLYDGYDFSNLCFEDAAGRERAVQFVKDFWTPHGAARASMLNDMEWGIPSEIDFINGEICKWGDRLGIDTPFNDEIVKIIKDFESGSTPFPTVETTVTRFNIPELAE